MSTTFLKTTNKIRAVATAGIFGVCLLLLLPHLAAAEVATTTPTTTPTTPVATAPVAVSHTPPQASAVYRATQLEGDQNYGDFVVGPGKFDLTVTPGKSETIEITVTNRTGITKLFTLTTEDMEGSNDVETPTVLLGDDRGPYTLRDFISVAADTFYIKPGERVTIPVTVSLPADTAPGGRYGSLLVQTTTAGAESNTGPAAAVVSRIAVLFFVTTPGELNQAGSLVDFTTVPDSSYFSTGPITFGLLYQNTGTVHTNPAGEITVRNMFGQEVGYLEVLPWFALPQSLRLREVSWDRDTLLGRYTATARVYRGYGEDIQTKELSFWVIDWKLLLMLTGVLLLVFLVIRYITRNFTLTRRAP